MKKRLTLRQLAAVVAVLSLTGIAMESSAATLSYSLVNPTGGANVVNGAGFVNVESVPGTDNYGNSFVGPTGKNLIIGAPLTGGGFGFYDDYIFQITSATVNSLTSTITLGATSAIENLQVRLFALPAVYGTDASIIAGNPPAINAWTTVINAGPTTITYSALPDTTLAAGTYVMQVRGRVKSTALNGSYSGVMNFAVVPVPAAVWLFGSALGLMGVLRRRAA